MFLECQKIDYYAKHCNMDPKKKGVVGKTSSYSFRTGIDYPKLRMEEEEEEGEGKFLHFLF